MGRAWRNPRITLSAGFILLVAAAGALAGVVAPHPPLEMHPSDRLQAPSSRYPFGTDEFGRDVLSRLLHGTRISLLVAFVAVSLAAVNGTVIGVLAAYYRGWVEMVLMRTVEVILSFPPVLLAIAVIAFLGASTRNVTLTIAVLYTPLFARIAYGSSLRVREMEFVEAARAMGAGDPRIIGRTLLPNILAPLMVQFSLSLGFAILLESGLSFLGMGPPPPAPSWGRMVSSGRHFMEISPSLVVFPSLVILGTVLSFNLLGDGLRDHLDPRLRVGGGRRESV
ncbi:MAG: ABC transporter permease [Armatimonadota bacterium]|nr:ABC transporter permease [Armatimonadota bacterium]